jgi:class 3 adenylate cyclase
MRFCGACGAALDPTDSVGAAGALDEELRHATVLFADLVGFTTFSEKRSADEVGDVVAAVLPRLFEVLRRYGGTAEKYLGDAVLSTFGLRHPDPHAGRSAVRAALELQRTMGDIRGETGRDLHLRVGVHSGEVMVRRIGSVWGVVGDTVNTAARLQEVADPDTVWISRSTYEEVRRQFEALPRPVLSLKGKSLPMQPYEVRRERDAAGTLALPFTGRDKEFALLTAELEAALDDAVNGDPPGMALGKRLERVARAVLLRRGLGPTCPRRSSSSSSRTCSSTSTTA